MKLRNLAGVAAGTVGLTALANRLLTARAGTFEPFLDGDRGTYRWRGFDVDYVEAGDPDDPDAVLLHGINAAASNHEFHAVVDELAEDRHVLAPDLPGFGHSDRPPLLYSASLLTTFVADFLADMARDSLVVASSLTGAYAAQAARSVPIQELVLICPTDETTAARSPLRRALFRSPLLGEAAFNILASKYSIRRFHRSHGYYDLDKLTSDVLNYEWATSHQPGARFAPASFVGGYLDPEATLSDALAVLDVPVTLVWGREAKTTPLSAGRDLADASDARLVVFDEAKLLPHVEHPEAFLDVLRGEYEQIGA